MGYVLIATEKEVYKAGLYPLEVANIEPKVGKVTKPDGTVADNTYLRWTFNILKRGLEGKTLSANSSTEFGPGAKGRKWAEALLDRSLHVNEPIDTDDLIGTRGMATLGVKQKGEDKFNEIEAFAHMEAEDAPPPRQPQRIVQTLQGTKAQGRVSLTGYPQDEEDIPFDESVDVE